MYDVFNTGDLFRMLDFFHPDIEVVHPQGTSAIGPGVAGVKRGHEQVREFFANAPNSRGYMRTDPVEFFVSGHRAVVFGNRRLTSLDGRTADMLFIHSYTFADGKVIRFEDHFDTLEMLWHLRPETRPEGSGPSTDESAHHEAVPGRQP
jgi:ketosteroid isomerase-like protein